MTRAEEAALKVYPRYEKYTTSQRLIVNDMRDGFIQGYEQAEKDTIAEVEKWLRANFHHRNCWNADEFCISLRTYFGMKK